MTEEGRSGKDVVGEGWRQGTRQALRLPPLSQVGREETVERPNNQEGVRETFRFAFCFQQNSLSGR